MDNHKGSEEQRRLPRMEPSHASLARNQLSSILYTKAASISSPDIVTVPLLDKQKNRPHRRQPNIRQTRLVVQPQPQTRIELADLSNRVRARDGTSSAAAPAVLVAARVVVGLAVEAGPPALRLRVLQGRRAARVVVVRGGEGAAGVVRGARGGDVVRGGDAAVLRRGGLVGGEVHVFCASGWW